MPSTGIISVLSVSTATYCWWGWITALLLTLERGGTLHTAVFDYVMTVVQKVNTEKNRLTNKAKD